MAKKQLTTEEKLQAALVPEEEQPYKVPENWCWVRLGNILVASKEKTDLFSSSTKYVGLENIEKDTGVISFGHADEVKSTKSVFKSGDILYGKLRPYLNKHGVVDFEGVCSTDILVFNAIVGSNKLYDFYFSLPHFIEYAISNSKGINLPRVSEKVILQIPFPLPPLSEQSRIVARIESLFAKLDEAKEKIQEVLNGAELRKAAILHQAFTGKLTEKWRQDKNISQDSWEVMQLRDCCDIGSGGTPSRKIGAYYQGNIPWVKTGEVNWNEIYDTEEHISEEAIRNSSAKLYQEGTVLVAMYGMGVTRGRAAILQIASTTNQAVCALQTKKQLMNKFLFYYFMNNYWIIREKSVGGNQLNLSGKIIEKLEINLPTINEQQEIVCLLDNLLSNEQSTVTTCESALATIDTLKKSILARVFRGELGTNDPSEASAKELLRRILTT